MAIVKSNFVVPYELASILSHFLGRDFNKGTTAEVTGHEEIEVVVWDLKKYRVCVASMDPICTCRKPKK